MQEAGKQIQCLSFEEKCTVQASINKQLKATIQFTD